MHKILKPLHIQHPFTFHQTEKIPSSMLNLKIPFLVMFIEIQFREDTVYAYIPIIIDAEIPFATDAVVYTTSFSLEIKMVML